MRRFVIRTLLFLLPLLIAAIGCEFYARSLPNSYRLKDNWLRSNAGRVETIILGNSHAYYGIRPELLEGIAFNAANVSQVAEYDLAILQRYAPLCPRLRNVILVADNSYLFDPPLEQTEPARCTYYNLYMHIGPHFRCGKYGFEIMQFDAMCEKFKAYNNGTYHICDSLGWGSDYKASLSTFDPSDTDNIQHLINKHTSKDWQYTISNMRHVESIARYCNQHYLHLTVVQTPVCEAYYERIPVRQKQALGQLMQRLKAQYQVTTIDFSSDSCFYGLDFFDADHLSDTGAAKFTQMLNAYLLEFL